jgi:hypothetical protein
VGRLAGVSRSTSRLNALADPTDRSQAWHAAGRSSFVDFEQQRDSPGLLLPWENYTVVFLLEIPHQKKRIKKPRVRYILFGPDYLSCSASFVLLRFFLREFLKTNF